MTKDSFRVNQSFGVINASSWPVPKSVSTPFEVLQFHLKFFSGSLSGHHGTTPVVSAGKITGKTTFRISISVAAKKKATDHRGMIHSYTAARHLSSSDCVFALVISANLRLLILARPQF